MIQAIKSEYRPITAKTYTEPSATFRLWYEGDWERLCDVLNDTWYSFASYAYKCVTVWGEKAITATRTALDEAHVRYKEVE